MTYKVYIVKTGTANIGSIVAGLKKVGAEPTVGDSASEIMTATHVVVPGVGTFGAAMELITENNCAKAIVDRVAAQLPTFFICAGMQILASLSEESPNATGLNVLNETITRFGDNVTVPQHGWNLVVPAPQSNFVKKGYAYFSNSYKLSTIPKGWACSMSTHGGLFVAALEMGNILACQFHPELSGAWGLALIHNWLSNSYPVNKGPIDLVLESELLSGGKAFRIVPCLDVKDGAVVKGIQFQNLKEVGVPAERALLYESHGADEIVILDISATTESRQTKLETIRLVRQVISIPLTVGGGVKTVEDVKQILESGADKVCVNTAAVRNPEILSQMAEKFGKQCTVLSLDAVQSGPGKWEVVVSAGTEKTGIDAVEWAKECEKRGVGEILLTSWNRDGTGQGYDLELIAAVSNAVRVPVVASGGASKIEHLAEAFRSGADAVLAASIFHYGDYTVEQIKQDLQTSFHLRVRV